MTRRTCALCGRPATSLDVYCTTCGTPLASLDGSEETPPGWLIASEQGDDTAIFEPLPAIPVEAEADSLLPPQPRVAWPTRRDTPLRKAKQTSQPVAEPRGPLPLADLLRRDDTNTQPAPDAPPATQPDASPTLDARPAVTTTPIHAGGGGAAGATAVMTTPAPPLRALYAPLLAVVLLSATIAVGLLVLHLLIDR